MTKRVVYVTRPTARVVRADGMVAVMEDRKIVDRWPASEVERVVVVGNAQVTTQAMTLLLGQGASVALLSPSGRLRGHIIPPESGNVFVRLAQHERYRDPDFRLAVSRALVLAKIRAGREQLLRFRRNHPASGETLERAAAQMARAATQAASVDSVDVLRGVEGAAAASYFTGFDAMVRAPFRFERRSKHPAHNAVNALLNLWYTLLASEVAGQLEAAGFDPRVGLLHGLRYGRSSLALDVMEPHRTPVVDRLVLSSINRRMLSPEDFEDHGGSKGVRLLRPALAKALTLYETAQSGLDGDGACPRERIGGQVSALRAAILSGRPDDAAWA